MCKKTLARVETKHRAGAGNRNLPGGSLGATHSIVFPAGFQQCATLHEDEIPLRPELRCSVHTRTERFRSGWNLGVPLWLEQPEFPPHWNQGVTP